MRCVQWSPLVRPVVCLAALLACLVRESQRRVIAGCTTRASRSSVPRPSDRAPLERNGVDPGFKGPTEGVRRVYTPACGEIDQDMGAVAAEIVRMAGSASGEHPLNSFAAAGPDARELVAGQTALDVYAPIRELVGRGGYTVLMGVGLEAMTALHLAEQMAGRRLFRRWANGPDGEVMDVSVGGCSRGFSALDAVLSTVERKQRVGNGLCRAFPLREVLAPAGNRVATRGDALHAVGLRPVRGCRGGRSLQPMRSCRPSARVIRTTVLKLGLPSGDSAL